ncbi:MAG: hypothetical protein ACE5OZ_18390 [Candidatus Heimdallarchaeota archaeon]
MRLKSSNLRNFFHPLPTHSDYFFFTVSSLASIVLFGLITGMGYVEGEHLYSILAPPGNLLMQLVSFTSLGIIYSFSFGSYPSPERVARGVSPWQVAREKAKENLGVGFLLGVGFWLLINLVYFSSGERMTFLPTHVTQIGFAVYLGIVIIATLSFNVLFFFGQYEFPEKVKRRKQPANQSEKSPG